MCLREILFGSVIPQTSDGTVLCAKDSFQLRSTLIQKRGTYNLHTLRHGCRYPGEWWETRDDLLLRFMHSLFGGHIFSPVLKYPPQLI